MYQPYSILNTNQGTLILLTQDYCSNYYCTIIQNEQIYFMRNHTQQNRTESHNHNHLDLKANQKGHSNSKKSFLQSSIEDVAAIKNQQAKHFTKTPQKLSKSARKANTKSVQNLQNGRLYRPYERNVKQFQKQKKNMYDQLQNMSHFRITNPQSYFLNQKYPKAPIYERAKQIMRKRQQLLQSERQRQARQRQEQLQRQYDQMKAIQSQRKPLKKEEAYELTNKLYKDHYSKVNRLNLYKIELLSEEAKLYREKPEMNRTSREIYNGLMKKNKMQTNIIDRFSHYDQQKKQHQKNIQDKINSQYYPFRPNISPSPVKTHIKQHSPSKHEKPHTKSSSKLKVNEQVS